MTSRGKGQMFMIAAIFMIVGFVLLKNLLSLPEISQAKAFQDTSYLDKNLENVHDEFAYLTGAASLQSDVNRSGGEYFYNFSRYISGEFDARILYVFIFSNGTTSNFSATVGNFARNNISGTFNVTGSTPPGRTFALNHTRDAALEFNTTSGWINVTLNYTIQNRETVERFSFNASTRNYAIGFFDVSFQERGFFSKFKST